ncbi:hypothetical protein [Cupriavidus nantongensis]|uniref:hypothetical protein n=1 Tax=Cupriavidus nantongensis TaxID=1796606 RepID=UPI00358FA2D2
MTAITAAMPLDSVATTGSSMSSGQTSANNKTWLARHLKTLFHTIKPSSTMGSMAPAMRMTTLITTTITATTTATPMTLNRRLPRVAAGGVRPASR